MNEKQYDAEIIANEETASQDAGADLQIQNERAGCTS